MDNTSAVRSAIKNKYDAMYREKEEQELAYQASLVVKQPELQELLKGHSKGRQIGGVFGSILWPLLLGFFVGEEIGDTKGGIIGAAIGALICVLPGMAVYFLIIGELENLDIMSLGLLPIYIIGMIIAFFKLVSNTGTNKKNKRIQQANDEKMDRYNEELHDMANKKEQSNKKIAEERRKMTDAANAELAKYDADANDFCQKALGNSSIAPMVEKTVEMFKRMISHQESGADVKYVEADFNYEVKTTGIVYVYESGYSNPDSEFNFHKERFHELNGYAECEGLAKALSVLVRARMKEEYPSELTSIRISNQDAFFTLHFKTANENFEAAKDIF